MADWKAALKAIKKELNSRETVATERGERPTERSPTPTSQAPSQMREVRFRLGAWIKANDPREPTPKSVSHNNSGGSRNSSKRLADTTTARPALGSEPRRPAQPASLPPVPDSFPDYVISTSNRQHAFKYAEKWTEAGQHTQLSNSNDSRPTDIVIGLDFGTSFTKAAVRIKDQVYAVTWEGVSDWPAAHLLPSEYSVFDDGCCHLGQSPEARTDQVRQRLKQPFFNPAVSSKSIVNAAHFLALVLRYVRAWTFHYHGGKIGTSTIRWMVNIGAPSNGLENQRIEEAYKRLGYQAWGISVAPGSIQMQAPTAIHEMHPSTSGFTDLIDLQVIPEFVAQIAGYVQSPRRRPGLHALVDIGGGSLDIATFMVHQIDGEDVFPFLIPEVRPLGTHMLNWNRWVDAPAPLVIQRPDELDPVMNSAGYAAASGLMVSHVAQRDSVYWKTISDITQRVFHLTKRNRYRQAPEWTSGLPTFITGGGAAMTEYGTAIQTGGNKCAQTVTPMQLPFHPRLSEFQGDIHQYQRVSVACGLAQDAFSLGRLIPAGKVEDDIPVQMAQRDRLDRDDLYSR